MQNQTSFSDSYSSERVKLLTVLSRKVWIRDASISYKAFVIFSPKKEMHAFGFGLVFFCFISVIQSYGLPILLLEWPDYEWWL